MKPRKNAHTNLYVLPGPLSDDDWRFDRLKNDGERFMAWWLESRRQIRGKGSAYLSFSAEKRERIGGQFVMKGRRVASRHVTSVFRFSKVESFVNAAEPGNQKPGRLLLALEVDCRAGIDLIVEDFRQIVTAAEVFNATPKARGGRRGGSEDYKGKLMRLAVTRLFHAFGAVEAARMYNEATKDKKRVDPADCHSFRARTEKDLKRIASENPDLGEMAEVEVGDVD